MLYIFDSLVVFCKWNMHPCLFLVNSGPLMLSMQYSNNNLSQQHQYSSHQHGLRSRYNLKHNSSNHHKRNRRLSGTFIPEHHLITVPPSQTTKNVSPISNPVEMFVPRKNNLEKLHWTYQSQGYVVSYKTSKKFKSYNSVSPYACDWNGIPISNPL